MGMFQKAPATTEEAEKYEPLDIGPEMVLEMTEEEWYEHIYRGADVPQLTIRAVAVGSALGFLLAFTNLYIGLKTGWALGVAITACILSYSLWTLLVRAGVARSQMTILETNCMQSTASSAGYSTGGTMVSAISAMLLLSVTPNNPLGTHINPWVLIGWTITLAALGTVMAIPMKRNLINRDRLKFPSGTAAAVTLQSLYSHGDVAMAKAKILAWAAAFGALVSFLLDFAFLTKEKLDEAGVVVKDAVTGAIKMVHHSILPESVHIFDFFLPAPGTHIVKGEEVPYKPSDWNLVMELNPVMIAAGALVGLRIGVYMLISGLVLVYGLGGDALKDVWTSPYGTALGGVLEQTEGATTAEAYTNAIEPLKTDFPGYADGLYKIQLLELDPKQPELTVPALMRADLVELAKLETNGAVSKPEKAWKEVGLWLGVSIMLSYGILQFLAQWRTILRAFSGIGRSKGDDIPQIVKDTEVPGTWFLWGTLIAGAGAIALAQFAFDIPFYFGALAVGLTFFLAMVAARATGESDITPVGAMGKIMQLTFGTIMPQSTNANLMSASITANSAGSAADLLNDLKSGYLLGANPRRQFIAQLWGIAAGTAATVIGFYILVPDASVMTGELADGSTIPVKFPAPAAQAWMAVAKVMTGGGLQAMHPMHRAMIFWGLGLGAAMLALELLFPKQRKWLPSATGIGLGLILPFNFPLSMFLGAVIAAVWMKKDQKSGDFYIIPIVSGLIAGLSIFGVIGKVMNTWVFK
jgi:uncharacterized oligopeptide transporter (OPT) family protein